MYVVRYVVRSVVRYFVRYWLFRYFVMARCLYVVSLFVMWFCFSR